MKRTVALSSLILVASLASAPVALGAPADRAGGTATSSPSALDPAPRVSDLEVTSTLGGDPVPRVASGGEVTVSLTATDADGLRWTP